MGSNEMFPAAFAGAMLAVIAVAMLVCIGITVLVCWLLYGCFNRIPAAHRKMEPGLVWLLLIPCFNLVWAFFVFLRLPDSYNSYFKAQGRTDGGDYGRSIGLAYAICSACSIVPYIGILPGLASLILLILFLVKAHGHKKEIPQEPAFVSPVPPPPPPVA